MLAGVKAKFNDIEDVFYKYGGNIAKISEHYNCSRNTIYQLMKHNKAVKELLDEVRNLESEIDLDMAEFVHKYQMTLLRENPAVAQRAAMYVLDNKGASRGYGKASAKSNDDKSFNINLKVDYGFDHPVQVQGTDLSTESIESTS